MARGITPTQANAWLDTDFATAVCFVKLHVGDPGVAATSNAAAGDTTRKQATMGAAAAGVKAMTSMSGVWTNVSTTETLSDVSIWTASSAGTFKWSIALSANQPWVNTNTFTLTALSFTISPLAA
jgi:hypothetical protein